MCRMIAKVSAKPGTILDEMLHCPYSLHYLSENGQKKIRGQIGKGQHRDGCGIAFATDNNIEVHTRGKDHVWDSSFRALVESAVSKIFIAHNRLASAGLDANTGAEMAQPFSIKVNEGTFALCHNGTVNSYVKEAATQGTSDSKLFLEKLVKTKEDNSFQKIIERLKEIIAKERFSSLTAMLINSAGLIVWRVFNTNSNEKKLNDNYYGMYFQKHDNSIRFSSEPLDASGDWTLMKNHSVMRVLTDSERLIIEEILL